MRRLPLHVGKGFRRWTSPKGTCDACASPRTKSPPPNCVLLVGAGKSGAEISYEVTRTHRTFLSGSSTGEIPFPHGAATAAFVLPLVRFMGTRVLTMDTPMGRKLAPRFIRHGAPLIRLKSKQLVGAGIDRVARVVGTRDGMPLLADDRVLEVANVIWCTGFRSDFGWIDLDAFDASGRPVQYRGVVASQPGLYFVGVEFLYSATSDVLPGVGRDAAYIAKHIAARAPAGADKERREVLADQASL